MSGSRFVLPYQTVDDASGAPLPGALLYFYITGTSTPATTYSDVNLTVPNSNPVVAGQDGFEPGTFGNIFLSPAVTYKVVLTDEFENEIWTADPVNAGSTASQFVFPPLPSAPTNPGQGQAYFDTTLGYPRIWNGASWNGFRIT